MKQGQVVDLQKLGQISRERKPKEGIEARVFLRVIIVIQLAIVCSKLTIETLEQGVNNMFKIDNKDTRTTPLASFRLFYR